MTIYEIDREIMSCLSEIIDQETGEIINVVVDPDKMDALLMARGEKVENVACWAKNVLAEVEAIDKEINALEKRKKSRESLYGSLKDYLFFALCGQKYKGVRADVMFRQTPSVAVDDIALLPKKYLRVKTTIEPDKMAIRKALQAGEVPGAHIELKTSTIIK